MDITHSKATKGNALRELAVKLGVGGAGRILSIGNYYNDVEMFAASAVGGIAVQNSPEEVKGTPIMSLTAPTMNMQCWRPWKDLSSHDLFICSGWKNGAKGRTY